jgi:hypothetical protein
MADAQIEIGDVSHQPEQKNSEQQREPTPAAIKSASRRGLLRGALAALTAGFVVQKAPEALRRHPNSEWSPLPAKELPQLDPNTLGPVDRVLTVKRPPLMERHPNPPKVEIRNSPEGKTGVLDLNAADLIDGFNAGADVVKVTLWGTGSEDNPTSYFLKDDALALLTAQNKRKGRPREEHRLKLVIGNNKLFNQYKNVLLFSNQAENSPPPVFDAVSLTFHKRETIVTEDGAYIQRLKGSAESGLRFDASPTK